MKKLLLIPLLGLGALAYAQTPVLDRLDLGNFIAPIRADGQLFQNHDLNLLGLEWPKTSVPADKRSVSFTSHVWFGGLDGQGALHVAAETYGQSGEVFHPGLYNFDGAQWDSVWVIRRSEVDQFRADFANNTVNFANYPIVAHWPAFGLDQNGQRVACAPFVDMDNDPQNYTPTAGDYPDFPGHQAVYFQFSDFPAPPVPYQNTMGLEVRAFAFVRDCPQLQDVLFLQYAVTNRSSETYTGFRAGLWNDFDIGNFADDYIASAPAQQMVIGFNGDANDETANGYGINPPAIGWTCLSSPSSGGMYYDNDFTVKGNPEDDADFYGYLASQWKDSSALVDNGLDGYPGTATGTPTNYPFNGNAGWCGGPATGWNEITAGQAPFDRRGLLSFEPQTMNPGETRTFTFAMLMARGFYNDNLGSGCELIELADSLHYWWDNQILPCEALTGTAPKVTETLEVFPNPTSSVVSLRYGHALNDPADVVVFDMTGRTVMQVTGHQGSEIRLDMQDLAPGAYHYRWTSGEKVASGKIIRQ